MGATTSARSSRREIRRIVSDTGPLLHLLEIGRQDILTNIGDVFVPNAVSVELTFWNPNWLSYAPIGLQIAVLEPPHRERAISWIENRLLDRGEAEGIALMEQISANWFVTDDNKALTFAKSLRLQVRGSLGIVLWAAETRHLSYLEAEQVLDQLAASSLWISQEVMNEAKALLNDLGDTDVALTPERQLRHD